MSVRGGDDILTIDPVVTVKNIPPVTRTNMVVTASVKKDIQDEVDKAVETHAQSINDENCNEIFAFRQHKGDIIWSVKMCNKCFRPTLVHADPWGQTCSILGEPVTQNVVAKYIDQFNSHKRLKQIVVWVMPEVEQSKTTFLHLHQGVGETTATTVLTTPTTNIINSHCGKRNWHGRTIRR